MTIRDLPTLTFRYEATRPERKESEIHLGEYAYIAASFRQDAFDFPVPPNAEAFMVIDDRARGGYHQLDGKPDGNTITVKLTREYAQGRRTLDCWFGWRTESGEVSIRYPLTLRVQYTPLGKDPSPSPLPPLLQEYVRVEDHTTGTVSPPPLEARIKKGEAAATDAQQALQDAQDALTVANGKASPQDVSNAVEVASGAIMNELNKKADKPITEIENAAGTEKYTLDGGVVRLSREFNCVLKYTYFEKEYTSLFQLKPLPWYVGTAFFINPSDGSPLAIQVSDYGIQGPNHLRIMLVMASSDAIVAHYDVALPVDALTDISDWVVNSPAFSNVLLRHVDGTVRYPLLEQDQIDGFAAKTDLQSLVPYTGAADNLDMGGKLVAADRFEAVEDGEDGYHIISYTARNIRTTDGILKFPPPPGAGGTLATREWAGGEFAKKGDLDGKLDKVTTVATLERAYTVDQTGTVQSVALISPSPTPNSIAKRDGLGRLSVGEPVNDFHTATKLYVDNAIARVPNVFVPVFSLLGRSTDLTSGAAPDYTTLASNIDSIRLAVLTALNDVAGIWLANCSPGVKRVRFVRAIQHSNQPTASALTSALQTGKLFWLTYTQFCVLCMEGGSRNYVPWNEMEERADALLQSSPVGEVTVTGQTNVMPFVLSFPVPSQVTDIPSDESVTLFIKFSTPISVSGSSLLVGVV